MGNDVYDMIKRHKWKYIISSIWIYKNKCTKQRFMICLRKNRLWHDKLYWPVYIKHRTTCTEWRGKMILHFKGSDYRKLYLSSTWYDMMDSFVMDREFTKSKVGSNLQFECRRLGYVDEIRRQTHRRCYDTIMMF